MKTLSEKLAGHGRIHADIAGAIAPGGLTMVCACGHREPATTAQVARYIAKGWPEHCGKTMGLVPSEDPEEAYRQGIATGKAIHSKQLK